MWKPPERLKHQSKFGRIPSVKQAAGAKLYSSVEIGALTLAERTWVPAMVPWRASDDGFVTQDVIDWYGRFAQGEPGAIVVEATGIRDIPSGPLLRIGDNRFIPGLRKLTNAVRTASGGRTKVFIQLIDFLTIRRRPDPAKYFQRYLEITDHHRNALGVLDLSDDEMRAHLQTLNDNELEAILDARELEALKQGYRERVTDIDLSHIANLPEVLPDLFASAARRAQAAGFDGVELHYAHAYTMASFLSALNVRGDGYGGARENRARLPLEVYRAVRKMVGEDFAVGCRFLSDDCIKGGNTIEDAKYFATQLAKAGFDFLSLSRGGKFEDAKQPSVGQAIYPYTGPSGYECMPAYISDKKGPFGRNVEPTAQIRAAVRKAGFETPIIVAGGIHSFEQAEDILANGKADIIAAARQSLADPDWFKKIRLGHGAEVRLCEYTNYCEGLDQKHKQVTCKLWDRTELDEHGVSLSADGRRRMTAPHWKPKN
jgi:2,4-dienoyl-CoA reductase-like NADH-dependent reductase (Old Yellow Enzyme family)